MSIKFSEVDVTRFGSGLVEQEVECRDDTGRCIGYLAHNSEFPQIGWHFVTGTDQLEEFDQLNMRYSVSFLAQILSRLIELQRFQDSEVKH